MDLSIRIYSSLLCVAVALPLLCNGQYNYVSTRATYYGSPDCLGTATGACGFGDYGKTVNNGAVSGVSRLYRNGTGCGACYQVRCKVPEYCTEEGTKVVVTDYGEGDRTDFIMSVRAYAGLARENMAKQLFAYGVVDVEYKRVPCYYSNYNVMVKIHEQSRYPDYLAVVVLYTGGMYDVTAVELWRADYKDWTPMRKAYGAVWDMSNLPTDAKLLLRFKFTGYANNYYNRVKWVQMPNALPSDWKVGDAYDTSVQLV